MRMHEQFCLPAIAQAGHPSYLALALQLTRWILEGRRPEVPEPERLPGGGDGGLLGLAAYLDLMQRCWAQDPAERPAFSDIVSELRQASQLASWPARVLVHGATQCYLLNCKSLAMQEAVCGRQVHRQRGWEHQRAGQQQQGRRACAAAGRQPGFQLVAQNGTTAAACPGAASGAKRIQQRKRLATATCSASIAVCSATPNLYRPCLSMRLNLGRIKTFNFVSQTLLFLQVACACGTHLSELQHASYFWQLSRQAFIHACCTLLSRRMRLVLCVSVLRPHPSHESPPNAPPDCRTACVCRLATVSCPALELSLLTHAVLPLLCCSVPARPCFWPRASSLPGQSDPLWRLVRRQLAPGQAHRRAAVVCCNIHVAGIDGVLQRCTQRRGCVARRASQGAWGASRQWPHARRHLNSAKPATLAG